MLESVLQPAWAFAQKDFLEAIRNPRVITISILIGIFLIISSAALAAAMVSTPQPGSGGAVPAPYEAWHNGTSGVLTGIAFGLTPVVIPFLPILAASRILQGDRAKGIFQLTLAKPVPPWGPALGKFAGLYAALGIPTSLISLGAVLSMTAVARAAPDGGFVAAYTAGNILLVGLYLLLTLVIGTVLPPNIVGPSLLIPWIGFNAIRREAFIITGRIATLLGAKQATTYGLAWTDLGTFTGLYQGFLAPVVPANLNFVVGSSPGLGIAAAALPWAFLAWFVGLYVAYAIGMRIVPNS